MLFTKQSFDVFALETLEERMEKSVQRSSQFSKPSAGSDPII